jgi:hypothetical protein
MPSINHRARISGERITDETILGVDIGPNAVGYTELTTGLQGSLGALGADSVGTTILKEPGVGSQNIYADAVYGAKIADDAIGSEHIENDAIGSSAMIGAGVIRGYNIANDAIGSEHIENDAIGSSAMIGAGVIRGYNIAAGAIGSQQLGDGQVHLEKLEYHPSMGSVGNVTAGGKYSTYPWGMIGGQGTVTYDLEPAVVLTAEGTYTAVLDHRPTLGSFKLKTISGTASWVHFIAIGYISR